MRDRIEDIIWDNCHDGGNGQKIHEAVEEIIAALPDMIAPLVFSRHPIGWNTDGFMIDTRGTDIYVMRGLYQKPRFDTVEEAIKACNAHHVAQIMAAFKGAE